MRFLGMLAMTLLVTSSLVGCSPRAKTLDSPLVSDLEKGRASGDASFDHAPFGALLEKYVSEDAGKVDYAGLKKDRAALDAYLESIARVDAKTLDTSEQKALLINAYNAYTLELILENYPGVESIRDLDKPWDSSRYKVAGYTLSLNDIEHGLLRPIYKDPRIHFVVNCASIGCPALRATHYSGDDEELEKQLEDATKSTLNNARYVSIRGDEVAVTKILKWYGEDFTDSSFQGHAESVLAYIARYNDAVAKKVEEGDPEITFLDYNWKLNDTGSE